MMTDVKSMSVVPHESSIALYGKRRMGIRDRLRRRSSDGYLAMVNVPVAREVFTLFYGNKEDLHPTSKVLCQLLERLGGVEYAHIDTLENDLYDATLGLKNGKIRPVVPSEAIFCALIQGGEIGVENKLFDEIPEGSHDSLSTAKKVPIEKKRLHFEAKKIDEEACETWVFSKGGSEQVRVPSPLPDTVAFGSTPVLRYKSQDMIYSIPFLPGEFVGNSATRWMLDKKECEDQFIGVDKEALRRKINSVERYARADLLVELMRRLGGVDRVYLKGHVWQKIDDKNAGEERCVFHPIEGRLFVKGMPLDVRADAFAYGLRFTDRVDVTVQGKEKNELPDVEKQVYG